MLMIHFTRSPGCEATCQDIGKHPIISPTLTEKKTKKAKTLYLEADFMSGPVWKISGPAIP